VTDAGAHHEEPDIERAAIVAALGLGDASADAVDAAVETASTDGSPRVRAAAIGAVVRSGSSGMAAQVWRRSIADPDAGVRRRAAELAPQLAPRLDDPRALVEPLLARLHDADVTVIEAAAYALGELGPTAVDHGATAALSEIAGGHDDALAREAAVAALGALGDPAGLPTVLRACTDKVTVRRRAVLALAPFSGAEVVAALRRALDDRDWQVRQAAEDLLEP